MMMYQPPNINDIQMQKGFKNEVIEKPMTMRNWIETFLLMLIPVVNIILMLGWAFGNSVNKSKKTFFQALLIFIVIGLILWFILAVVAGISLSSFLH